MIDIVYGTVIDTTSESVIVKLPGGICLAVLVPEAGVYEHHQEVTLYTHLLLSGAVSGDGEFKLYGLRSKPERTMFLLLKSVSGVGGKAALSILSKGLEDVTDAIVHNEPDSLRVKGVGPKITKRIVDDLGKKVARIFGG